MEPKKKTDNDEHYRQEVAEKLGVPIEEVNLVIDYFWKKTKEGFTSPNVKTIEIPCLGYFCLRKKKMRRDLRRYLSYFNSKVVYKNKIYEKVLSIITKKLPYPEWDKALHITQEYKEQEAKKGDM